MMKRMIVFLFSLALVFSSSTVFLAEEINPEDIVSETENSTVNLSEESLNAISEIINVEEEQEEVYGTYIKFNTGIDGYLIEDIYLAPNTFFDVPMFACDGYEFLGAYSDAEFTKAFVGGTFAGGGSEKASETTLYLKFNEVVIEPDNTPAQIDNITDRLEGIIYVQITQSIMFGVMLFGFYFYRKSDGLGI